MWVEQLPSGRYRGGYRDAAGRKRSRTFLHKAAARRWAQDGEDAVARGQSAEAGRITVAVWAARWQASRVVSDVTSYNERSRVQAVVDEFGSLPIERMSTLDIQSWEKRLAAGGLSSGTVRLYHGTLTSMLAAAVRERLLFDNPAKYVMKPPSPRGREVYLTPLEVDAVADVLLPAPYDLVVRLQPYLGFRWGEIAGLRVMDLDMLRRTAQVRQVVVQIAGERTVRPYGKTVSSFRTVPIPPVQAELLAGYLAAHPRPRDGLVFLEASGRPLSRGLMSRAFAAAVKSAGVGKDARPHDLRHSGASWLAGAGVPIVAISKWLGHSNVQATMRYLHAAQSVVDDEVAQALTVVQRGTKRGTGIPERRQTATNDTQP